MTATRAVEARAAWLLAATFLIAVAGLIYELIAATLSSYLLGDSVRQFSLVIGIFLSAMGVGAWLSRFVTRAFSGFVWAQILLGVVGGFMAPVLFLNYAWMGHVALPLYATLIAIGILSGMEIPLIARVLEEIGALKFRFENVLSADYVGALVASLAFPLFVIPHLGLMSASLAFGGLNLAVAGLSLLVFREWATRMQVAVWALAFVATLGALVLSERLVSVTEAELFEDDIILSEATPYQQITVTRYRDRVRLFLDHSIQFDSLDERRYHEPLVHPAMALAPRRANVLILGGGDGMAVRELLRYHGVQAVTLVDLDPRVTALFRDHDELAVLSANALRDARVTVVNEDAWKFLERDTRVYDVVIIDLPDPKNIALSRLYTRQFYGLLAERLSGQGVFVTQAGSPFFARQAFWSVVETIESSRNPQKPGQGLHTVPYHSYVPSFGQWGFVLAAFEPISDRKIELPDGLSYLNNDVWRAAQVFGEDIDRIKADVNTLQSHALIGYYLDGWDYWFR
ncbi:polyamine aminopropyltransferase [Ruegeria sp. HKCCD8929]|uniref:polyamine aminopropyltransferase n=1 Tax=Ruegeria sp. HKCCD8929 TaxID=2683006 RepID=UPI001487EBE8|nr:polyamine aminopropyltransferase [Ruegeria sp. HKCCD8929]